MHLVRTCSTDLIKLTNDLIKTLTVEIPGCEASYAALHVRVHGSTVKSLQAIYSICCGQAGTYYRLRGN